jgi:transcriptional regulator with XRE-family HTH domain
MTDDLAGVLGAVGSRLRDLRRQHETTLTALAEATDISVSTLSRLESGQRRPTLELLLPLARAYGVQLDELVGAPPTGDPRVHMRPVRGHNMTMIPLTRRPGGVQAYKVIIPVRRSAPELRVHEGYEWIYVLSGDLRLLLGDQDFIVRPGEAALVWQHRSRSGGSAHSLRTARRARPPAGQAGRSLILIRLGRAGQRHHSASAPP